MTNLASNYDKSIWQAPGMRAMKYGRWRTAADDPFALVEAALPGFVIRVAIKHARLDLAFDRQLRLTPAYRALVRHGVDAQVLRRLCRFFHAFERAWSRADELAAREGPRPPGRPPDHFWLFLLACDRLVSGRADGRRFYAEFAALARPVFRKTIKPESYHRALMRAYEKFSTESH
jgi:hypothetical protein